MLVEEDLEPKVRVIYWGRSQTVAVEPRRDLLGLHSDPPDLDQRSRPAPVLFSLYSLSSLTNS